MNEAASKLIGRLVLIQVVVWSTAGLIVMMFAPRLLLLDPAVVVGTAPLALRAWLVLVGLVAAGTLITGRRVQPLLRAIVVGVTEVEPADVHALYATPARLVGVDLIAVLAVSLTTLAPPLRPLGNDLSTQAELVLLTMTMASLAALSAYGAMRAVVARVFELVPVASAREALERLGPGRARRTARLRRRLLAAVVPPVAFVALGASLLVRAHLRAFEASARQTEASQVVEGMLDTIDGDVRGRGAAMEAARARGLRVQLHASPATFAVVRIDSAVTVLTMPLSFGHAVVRYDVTGMNVPVFGYLAFAVAAIAIAGALGWPIARAFAEDVALARHKLQAAGVADVLSGRRMRGGARFRSVASLMDAADELGSVFRAFAGAQQHAIVARAATERMRGRFLASMSHDLKAPLNATLGFAELVSREPLTEGQRESVVIIEQRGRELLYLIDTILDAARVEAGELAMTPDWAYVRDAVMPAVLDARRLSAADVDIVGEVQPGLPRIRVDLGRLTQALTAIILAAARFAERDHVVVRATRPVGSDRVRIDVEFSGRSMTAADREKIFDAFKHADPARPHRRVGLGPSLARAIIELQGGTIDVETTEAGATIFRAWVPSERTSSSRG